MADSSLKAVHKAVEEYDKAILNGDTGPDSSGIDAAAAELTGVCTSWA